MNIQKSIAAKFNVLSILLVILTATGIATFVIQHDTEVTYQKLLNQGKNLAAMIAQNSEIGVFTENGNDLDILAESISVYDDIQYLFIANSVRTPIAGKVYRPGFEAIEIYQELLTLESENPSEVMDIDSVIVIKMPVYPSGTENHVNHDFTNGENGHGDVKAIGYVYLGINKESIAVKTSKNLTYVSVVAGIAIILSIIFGFIVSKRLGAPLNHLLNAMEAVSDGDLNQKVEVIEDDEISRLGSGFNMMVDRLEKASAELEDYQDHLEEKIKERTEELEKSRDAAEAGSRAKSEFLATMSHEIRTPMNGVMGMTELLLGTPLDDKQRRFANIVHRSGEILLTIINDVLDYSKIEAGHFELESESFCLRKLVEDTGEDYAEFAIDNGVELICEIPTDLTGSWMGDRGRLRQVLTNLVGNAIKFTSDGEVVLALQLLEDSQNVSRIRFEVRDTGVGIDVKAQERIFESFTQADGSTTRTFGGTGLGLAISKQLVHLMGGEIGVESVVGEGAVFWFEISLEKMAAQSLTEMPSSPLHGLRVLVVDDNETNKEIMRLQLDAWKMQYSFAASGQKGLNELRSAQATNNPYDLIILDMHMPEMDGLQMAQLAQADSTINAVPIILLSSVYYAESDTVLKAAGIHCHLTKPTRQAELYDCITKIMFSEPHNSQLGQADTRSSKQESVASLNGNILLVEDNPVNQEVTLGMLDTLHCKTTIVGNGLRALEKLDENSFDLILMDCQMPEMDGFTATRVIRKRERSSEDEVHLPIVALTANALAGDRERCLEAGMDDYLSKPISLNALSTTLRKWLPATVQIKEVAQTVETGEPADMAVLPASGGQVNPVALDNIRALSGGDALLAKVITTYLADSPLVLAALSDAVAQRDTDDIQALAHKFKSSNANLGAERLAELCRELEVLGRSGEASNTVQRLVEIEAEYEKVAHALKTDYLQRLA